MNFCNNRAHKRCIINNLRAFVKCHLFNVAAAERTFRDNCNFAAYFYLGEFVAVCKTVIINLCNVQFAKVNLVAVSKSIVAGRCEFARRFGEFGIFTVVKCKVVCFFEFVGAAHFYKRVTFGKSVFADCFGTSEVHISQIRTVFTK